MGAFSLNNSGYEYIIFCWVIHEEYILKQILNKLTKFDFELYKISLVCSKEALKSRLSIDVKNGIRNADVINRSIDRISFYERMDTVKIDVSNTMPEETVKEICVMVQWY